MAFHITAVWDEDAGLFYSDSNIVGLHIEAETIEEFQAIALDLGPEMILANHVTTAKSLKPFASKGSGG